MSSMDNTLQAVKRAEDGYTCEVAIGSYKRERPLYHLITTPSVLNGRMATEQSLW